MKQPIRQFIHQPNPNQGMEYKESTASRAVNALLDFAGAAAPAVTKKINDKIESDAVRQMMLYTTEGRVESDATRQGKEAAYAIEVQRKVNKLSSDVLNNTSLTYASDKELQDYITGRMDELRLEASQNFPDSNDPFDLGGSLSQGFLSAVPNITTQFQANRLKEERGYRLDETLGLMTESITGQSEIVAARALANIVNNAEKLQLTEKDMEALLVRVAENTDNLGVFRMAKDWNGSHDTSFFDRSGTLQQLERRRKAEITTEQNINLWNDKDQLYRAYMGGMSDKELDASLVSLEGRHGRKPITESEYRSWKAQRHAEQGAQYDYDYIIKMSETGEGFRFRKDDGSLLNAQEKQGFYDQHRENINRAYQSRLTGDMSPGEQAAIMNQGFRQAIYESDNIGAQTGTNDDFISNGLASIVRINPEPYLVAEGETGRKDFNGGVDYVNGVAVYTGIYKDWEILNAVPVTSLGRYVSGDDKAILYRARRLHEQGRTPAEAMFLAKSEVRDTRYRPSTANEIEAAEDTMSSIRGATGWWSGLWGQPIPESAEAYMTRELATEFRDIGTDNYSKDVGKQYLQDPNNYTYLKDGSPLKGSRNVIIDLLTSSLGKEVDPNNMDLDNFVGAAKFALFDEFKAYYKGATDLKYKDLQFDIDIISGTANVYSGSMVMPRIYLLPDLGKKAYETINGDEYLKFKRERAMPSDNRPEWAIPQSYSQY